MSSLSTLVFAGVVKFALVMGASINHGQATDLPYCDHESSASRARLSFPSVTLQDQFQNKLTVFEIVKDTAFVIEDSSFAPSYSMVIATSPQDILIIDTPYTPNGMEAVLVWIEHKFGKAQHITAINTHHHVDRLGGNKALRDRGIDVYASDLTLELLKEKREKVLVGIKEMFSDSPQSKNLQFTPPNKSISLVRNEPYLFRVKDNTIHLYLLYPGHAHSKDNIVVFIPELKILFAGCMISCLNRDNLGFVGEADIPQWKTSYENLRTFIADSPLDYVIPGHSLLGHVPNIEDFSPKMLEYTHTLIIKALEQSSNL